MTTNVAEIFGLFLVVIGCGGIVAAAAMVTPALAVLAAGVFLTLGGVLLVHLANAAAAARKRGGSS